jgi:hypothetical protein
MARKTLAGIGILFKAGAEIGKAKIFHPKLNNIFRGLIGVFLTEPVLRCKKNQKNENCR